MGFVSLQHRFVFLLFLLFRLSFFKRQRHTARPICGINRSKGTALVYCIHLLSLISPGGLFVVFFGERCGRAGFIGLQGCATGSSVTRNKADLPSPLCVFLFVGCDPPSRASFRRNMTPVGRHDSRARRLLRTLRSAKRERPCRLSRGTRDTPVAVLCRFETV